MIARWLAGALVALGVLTAAPAFAQVNKDVIVASAEMMQEDDEVIATGSRASSGFSPPYVSLVVPADFVIFTVTLETGTRAQDARAKELEATFKTLADRVGKSKDVTMEVGYPGSSSALETAAAKEAIRVDGDRSRISLVLKFAVQKNDTFGAVRARAEKFIAAIQITGRVEAVAGPQQYIGVSEPKKHREALLRKIADDTKLLQTIFTSGGQPPTISMAGLEGRVLYRPSGPLELEMYIPYSIVLGSPQPQR
jgi:hypothetical protein